jgi:ketosteroid isomerase-like protein
MPRLIPLVLLLPFAVSACLPQSEPAASTEEDVAAVLAVRAAEVASITTGDTVIAHVANDIVLMPPNAPAVSGKAAARAWSQELSQQMTIQAIDYTSADVVIAGDWAIERYAGSLTMTPLGGETMSETLKGIHIYRRQADGSWKLAQDVWNSDQPLPDMP